MQENVLRFVVDHALEMVLMFSASGEIIYANEAARLRLEYGDELQRYSVADIFPNYFWLGEEHFETQCVPGDAQELMAYRKNRTCFPVWMVFMQYEENPKVYLCMANDISERNLLKSRISQIGREAEDAEKVKSEFVANVTHELRTPVNGILGNTRELLERTVNEKDKKQLALIERGCQDMHAIINNILDFSKLEAGKFTLEVREFDFRSMIEYVKSNHINKITEKGLELFVSVSPEVPKKVIGDELRIVQVLNNLLSNAVKFTSVGNIIVKVVKTAQIDNRAELFFMVIDSGIGVDKADQDKLFRSFSQVDASISRRYGGTGLGLNICKQLVELMGGSIHVESEKNKGSTFAFHIWVEISGEEMTNPTENVDVDTVMQKIQSMSADAVNSNIWEYGEQENLEELGRKMSKLILSVEMENWEKAEMFADTVRQLTEKAPREIKSAALRLKMAVQKGDYEKTTSAFGKLQELL